MAAPSGTVTFLFSDIEGSTVRWEAHSEAMRAALARHDRLVRVTFERRGGHVFKTIGDAFCVAFSRPTDAIAAAVDAQRAIGAEDWSCVEGLRVRMAIHSGVADERDGDYFGPTVNRVARLLSAAHGEQILVSQVTAQLAGSALASETSLRDLGTHRLKDIPQPEPVFQVVSTALRSDFPPLRSIAENPTNLPLQITPFFGRDEELREIEDLLLKSRLLTLTGSGGVGKTRTALEVATRMRHEYNDGTWFADFAPLGDGKLVPGALASVFHVEATEASLQEDLIRALKDKSLLILFDNCEHVVESAAACAQRLCETCPRVCILATSRQALGVAGERTYRMPSLPSEPAVELFLDRARAVQAGFELDARNEPAVREIVRRLDGIALAIELAASRVKVFSVDRIAKGLDDRFRVLAGGNRTALPRQQTLRALIGWSYDLLSEPERSMLQQLAVFRGGWSIDAPAGVCVDARFADWDAESLLESLVEKSLVVADAFDGDVRYRMLESTREFALERLHGSPEHQGVFARHCAYYVATSERAFDAFWKTNLHEWNSDTNLDVDNYRAAVDWALVRARDSIAGVALVANLSAARFPEMSSLLERASSIPSDGLPDEIRGRVHLARARLSGDRGSVYDAAREAAETFESGDEGETSVEARLRFGGALWRMGRVSEAVEHCERALALGRRLNVSRLIAFVLTQMGLYVAVSGDRERGIACYREAIATLESLGDVWRLSVPLLNLGEALALSGDFAGALQSVREARETSARRPGGDYDVMFADINIAAYLLALGRSSEARAHARSALSVAIRFEQLLPSAVAIGHLAEIAAMGGRLESAARLVGYTDAVYARLNVTREPTERGVYDRTMERLRKGLVAERLAALTQEGTSYTDAAAGAEAMAVPQPVTSGEAFAL